MKDYGERESIYLELKIDNPDYKSVLFTDGEDDFWIPRSLLHPFDEHVHPLGGKDYEVQVPIWFAEQEGLI